jgi:PIN domain nuclease of toxin-antitoxin system
VKLLLDTHSLIWWFNDDQRLGQQTRAMIADRQNDIFVSCSSFWEISIKHRIGKLDENGFAMHREALASGFSILTIEAAHLAKLEELPLDPDFKDPFGNLIMAQAIVEKAALITSDRKLLKSGVKTIRAK